MTSSPKSHSKPRVAVVGAAGRLGTAVSAALAKTANVIEITRAQMDLGSGRSIETALEAVDFDILVLTAALTAVDFCETNPEIAFSLNADAPGTIAGICARRNARMTYISTDFVFDGEKDGPYGEKDVVNAISVYGASKLKGEERVLDASGDNLVTRVSWLYGPGKPAFPEWIVGKACGETEISLPADKIGCPTLCTDLADMLGSLLFTDSGVPASGIVHLCNSGPCTWQEWGQRCIDLAKEAGLPVSAGTIRGNTLADIPAFAAKRPRNTAMSTDKFTTLTGLTPRPWADALQEYLVRSDLFRKYQAISSI